MTEVRGAVERKGTETEFGRCSQTRLPPEERWYGNESYMRQVVRTAGCEQTEQRQTCGERLPEVPSGNAHEDHMPGPYGETYQIGRTVLAARGREGRSREPERGMVWWVRRAEHGVEDRGLCGRTIRKGSGEGQARGDAGQGCVAAYNGKAGRRRSGVLGGEAGREARSR